MGAIGGIVGALFNFFNLLVTRLRKSFIKTRIARFIEVIVIAALTAALYSILATTGKWCVDSSTRTAVDNRTDSVVPYFCDEEGKYNVMATLTMTGQENVMLYLFHESSRVNTSALLVFMLIFFVLSFVSLGAAVPAGFFLPSMMTGALLGRWLGEIIKSDIPELNPGLLALIGAATVLGGVCRMPVSLTIIMCEATNQASYTLPMMMAMIVAKGVGDVIMPGITEIGFRLKQYPILQWDTPSVFKFHRVKEIMNHPVITLNRFESIRQLVTVLHQTTHNGFPVIDNPDPHHPNRPRRLLGVVLRSQLEEILLSDEHLSKLCYLLENDPEFSAPPQSKSFSSIARTAKSNGPYGPSVTTTTTTTTTTTEPGAAGASSSVVYGMGPMEEYSEEELSGISIDLGNVYNHCLTVHRDVSCSRVFTLFRQIGLRHLIVVDHENVPIGVVTRKDLFFLHSDLKDSKPENKTSCWASLKAKLYGYS